MDHGMDIQDRADRVVGVVGAHDERYALKAVGGSSFSTRRRRSRCWPSVRSARRYAWALVQQFADPDRRTADAVEPLAQAAIHHDARLTGPVLVALAMLGPPAHPAIGAMLAKRKCDESAVVVWGAATWACVKTPDMAEQMVPAGHAIRTVAAYASQGEPSDDVAWTAWLAATRPVQLWLQESKLVMI